MPMSRGTFATFQARAREGVEQELGLRTQITVGTDGRVMSQNVTINYDAAWQEIVKALLDDLQTNVTNATFRTQLANARTALGL